MKSDTNPPKEASKDAPVKQVARVKILESGTMIRRCLRAAGAIVDAVPLSDAEYKQKEGKLTILSVSDA